MRVLSSAEKAVATGLDAGRMRLSNNNTLIQSLTQRSVGAKTGQLTQEPHSGNKDLLNLDNKPQWTASSAMKL